MYIEHVDTNKKVPVSAYIFFECFILTNTKLYYAVTHQFNYMVQNLFLLHWQG